MLLFTFESFLKFLLFCQLTLLLFLLSSLLFLFGGLGFGQSPDRVLSLKFLLICGRLRLYYEHVAVKRVGGHLLPSRLLLHQRLCFHLDLGLSNLTVRRNVQVLRLTLHVFS